MKTCPKYAMALIEIKHEINRLTQIFEQVDSLNSLRFFAEDLDNLGRRTRGRVEALLTLKIRQLEQSRK